jgi:hypothetical protein
MDIQTILAPMGILYIGLIVGILCTGFYALILLIKALKIYIKKNS